MKKILAIAFVLFLFTTAIIFLTNPNEAQGTIIFSDTFTQPDGPATNWEPPYGYGKWEVRSYKYYVDAPTQATGGYGTFSFVKNLVCSDFEMEVDVTALSSVQPPYGRIGIVFRWIDGGDRYVVEMGTSLNKYGISRFTKEINGNWYNIATSNFKLTIGQNYRLKLTAVGSQFLVYANDIKIFNVTDTSHAEGKVGLYSNMINGWFDYVVISDLTVPPPTHTLTVESSPVVGISFTIKSVSYKTNCSINLEEGAYTVTMPEVAVVSGVGYKFVDWEDGSTNPTRAITLTADKTIIANYAVAPPLQASITVQSYTVTFKGEATSGVPPYTFLWNFGDGTTSTEQNPTHTYISAGSYTVTLTVTDSLGAQDTKTTVVKLG